MKFKWKLSRMRTINNDHWVRWIRSVGGSNPFWSIGKVNPIFFSSITNSISAPISQANYTYIPSRSNSFTSFRLRQTLEVKLSLSIVILRWSFPLSHVIRYQLDVHHSQYFVIKCQYLSSFYSLENFKIWLILMLWNFD